MYHAGSYRSRCFLLQEKAAALLAAYRGSPLAVHSLLSFPELRSLSSHICPDESTLCMALLQLQREKHVTVSLHEGEKVGVYMSESDVLKDFRIESGCISNIL